MTLGGAGSGATGNRSGPMRFRLRYLNHDLALTEGPFVVGRSTGCELSLDDALVSRRHAVIMVASEGVTIEDLASRNGVMVNGQRISSKTPLKAGDRVLIGSQELTLLAARPGAGRDTMGLPNRGTVPRMASVIGGASESPDVPQEDQTREDSSMVRRVTAFKVLGGVADKALAMGRVDEAERLLAGPLADVVGACRSKRHVSPWIVDIAAHLAAKLATATAKGVWADYVIEVFHAQGRPCPAPVVDELYSAFRKVNAIDLARLRTYVSDLREKQAALGPAERFLLQRIEGLERLAALR
ncbi:MAG: FHA domain-containing protein [Polyangiaceae bacterium]